MGKVLAPINNPLALDEYIAAGIEELYVGFFDLHWHQLFGPLAGVNRMSGFGRVANSMSFDGLLSLTQEAKHKGVDLYVTFNAAGYSEEQCAYIERNYLPSLAWAGATGIIVSSPMLAEAAAAHGLDCVASTMCDTCNTDIIKVYCDLGISRVILPRDLSLAEIRAVVEELPEMSYEVFLMRNGCMFSDAHCLGLHKDGQPSLCRSLREGSRWECSLKDDFNEETLRSSASNGRVYRDHFHQRTCGLCALWQFEQLGIDAYKIVGRCDDVRDLCKDISLIAENREKAQACKSEAEYLEIMTRPRELHAFCEKEGLSCYYPEKQFFAPFVREARPAV